MFVCIFLWRLYATMETPLPPHSLIWISPLPTSHFFVYLFDCSWLSVPRSCNNYMAFYTPTYSAFIYQQTWHTQFYQASKNKKKSLVFFGFFLANCSFVFLAWMDISLFYFDFYCVMDVLYCGFFSFLHFCLRFDFAMTAATCPMTVDRHSTRPTSYNNIKTCVIALFTEDDDVLHASNFTESFRFSSSSFVQLSKDSLQLKVVKPYGFSQLIPFILL